MGIAVIDQRGKGSGFTRAGAADKQDQAAFGHDQLAQHRWQTEFLDFRDIDLDIADYHADFVALPENIDTETTDFRVRNGKIHFG